MSTRWRAVLAALLLTVLLAATLGGVVAVYVQASGSRENTRILRCQAEANQQFRRDITDLLRAGRDPKLYRPLVARMTREAKTNYAHLDHGHCPTVLKE